MALRWGVKMNMRAEKVEISVEELKDSTPSGDGSGVVLETESLVDGERYDTLIEVQHEDVPSVAVALLNADGESPPPGAEETPALRCLGAGVVHWDDPESVRFHLQFESGQVLPIQMSRAAALALCRGLFDHAAGAVGLGWDMPAANTRPDNEI